MDNSGAVDKITLLVRHEQKLKADFYLFLHGLKSTFRVYLPLASSR
jgi:hypothetical protein